MNKFFSFWFFLFWTKKFFLKTKQLFFKEKTFKIKNYNLQKTFYWERLRKEIFYKYTPTTLSLSYFEFIDLQTWQIIKMLCQRLHTILCYMLMPNPNHKPSFSSNLTQTSQSKDLQVFLTVSRYFPSKSSQYHSSNSLYKNSLKDPTKLTASPNQSNIDLSP